MKKEFDRQVQVLLDKGYPQAAGMTEKEFLVLLKPLESVVSELDGSEVDLENGYLPFVIVVQSTLVPADVAMGLVDKDGKPGIVKLFPLEPSDFEVIDGTSIPQASVYILADIDRGKENRNMPPSEAMEMIEKAGRLPLTIDEGVAIVTQFPDFLMKNNCFSLIASRHAGDQRVPAIWINAKKNPNLGWCWNGNPHTWLGSASGGVRFST